MFFRLGLTCITIGSIIPSDSIIALWVVLVAVAVRPRSGIFWKTLASEPSLLYAGLKSFL